MTVPDPDEEITHLAAIVESSGDAIIGQNEGGTILSWNRGAEEVFCYSAAEALGQPIFMLIPADRRPEFEALLDRAKSGQQVRQRETVWRTKGDFPIEVAITVSPILDRSRAVVGVSIIARDVMEQRWIAATLDATMGKLEAALAAAQDSESRTRRFLADAAHQLRGPMASIRTNAETILGGVGDDDRDRLLRNLVREVARGDRLIRSLLMMARLDEGETLVRGPCDPVALCCDEADRTWSLAPHLDIVVKADELPAETIHLDAGALREIVANLLDNARRHAADSITLLLAVRQATLEICVVDDGPGMVPDMAMRAFDRFASLDGKGGSGLGLPIARELARAHGGDLAYEGREQGFMLRLPVDDHDGGRNQFDDQVS